jgi:hypothetical protein
MDIPRAVGMHTPRFHLFIRLLKFAKTPIRSTPLPEVENGNIMMLPFF